MAAPKKSDVEKLEKENGLDVGDLTWPQRCSRFTAYKEGVPWLMPETEPRATTTVSKLDPREAAKKHPLYGRTILLTPLMKPDQNQHVYYDEVVGHEIEVEEIDAGALLYDKSEKVENLHGTYQIIREDKGKPVIARTTLPKIGTELTIKPGFDLVPVVRGNDRQRGYIWSFPSQVIQIGDTMIQLHGLKTLIQNIYPELLLDETFKGKPGMMYIDGVTLAASIPYVTGVLKKKAREERRDVKAGLAY